MSTNLEAENNNDVGSQPESGAQKDAKGQKGGKKNKQKGKTMSLAAFNAHAEQHTVANWADHVETVVNTRQSTQPSSGAWQPKQSSKYVEPESAYDLDVDPIRSQLPTAPRAAREAPVVDLSRIPEDGPFKVHVGNLPFDVTEQAVASFFNAQEKQVNLIREGGRPKGFGFVELASRDLLIEALSKNGESMRGRAIKVALATAPVGSENERNRDRDERSNRGWRSTDAPREEVERNWRERRDDRPPERRSDDRERFGDDRERRFDDRGRFDDRDRRYDGGRRFGDRERRFDDGGRRFDDRERRFDDGGRRFDDGGRRFDDRERRFDDGGRRFDDRERRFDDRRRFDRERDQDEEPRVEESNWRRGLAQRKPAELDPDGAERSADSEPRREFSPEAERRDREPERERERDREPVREREREREPERERESERDRDRDRDSDQKPRERPKLNLQPRTKPLAEVGVQSAISEATRKAIFGGAKPVDTVAREREIEQRLDAEREKFEHAHELDEAVANRTRRRTVSSSSNTSNRRYDEPPARQDDPPAADRERERLNSVRSNTSRLAEEEDADAQRERPYRAERADRADRPGQERTWYRGGAPRGRFQRPAAQSDRRPPSDRPQGDDEYFYDDDYRSERPQSEADDETPTYYGSAAHRQAPPRGAGRWGSRPGRTTRAPHDAQDEDGFQQVGAGGRAVPGGSATHRPPEYPGGKPTSGTAVPKRPEVVKKDKEELPPLPATLIHKSKFSALDEDAPDEE